MPCCHLRQVTTAIRGLANKEVLQGQQEVKQAVLSALEQAEQRLAEQAERHRLYYIRAWSLLVAKLASASWRFLWPRLRDRLRYSHFM